MSDKTIMLFGNKEQKTRPASEIIKGSIGFENVDNQWMVTFQTIENRKGYGRQRVPVADYPEFVAVLQDAATNGITREDEALSCVDVVRRSIIEAEDGSIRFKTEPQKGKKPTLFTSLEDFSAAVETLASVSELIAKKAKSLK